MNGDLFFDELQEESKVLIVTQLTRLEIKSHLGR